MTNNQLTEAELTETLDAATSGYPLTASAEANLRRVFAELQERRKTAAEPAAYLVCNGRLYQDRPFLSLSAARISVNDRNDGAEIKALCVSGALAEKAK